jgi:hypothetical protein
VFALVIGLALVFAGCGSSDDPKPRSPAGDLRDLEQQTVDTATKAQLERFAEVRIPASATNLRSFSRSALDTQVLMSFRIPRADLDAFVRSGNFQGTLRDDYRAITTSAGEGIGWDLDKAKHVQGLADVKSGLGRNLLVVLDDPQRPAVYLEAATL